MDTTLSERDKALIDLLWDYMRKDKKHKDRVHTGFGTKTQFGLARSIDGIYEQFKSTNEKGA